jgi:hypothetical protein
MHSAGILPQKLQDVILHPQCSNIFENNQRRHPMKTSILRIISICLLGAVVLTGCASRGSEFLGSWVNTKNPSDTFHVTQNGNEFLIVSQDQKSEVGAIYKDGALEVKGGLLSADLTYVKRTDTILTPGFFGQVEYKRQK